MGQKKGNVPSPSRSRIYPILAAAGALLVLGVLCWLLIPRGGRDRIREVEKLLSEGKISSALEAAEQELSAQPDDPLCLATAARVRFQVGDYKKGEECYRRLIAGAARPAEAWLDLARLQAGASRRKEAYGAAKRALEIDPRMDGARAIMARYLLDQNRYEDARDLTAPGVQAGTAGREELLAHGRALLKLEEFQQAAEALGRAVKKPGAGAEDLCALGEALNGSKEYRRAADLLAELLEENPFSGRAYYLLGRALARLGSREPARWVLKAYEGMRRFEHTWSRIQEIDRASLRNRASYERGLYYSDTGQFRLALFAYRRAVAIQPDVGPLILEVARKLVEMEAYQESREILERAIRDKLQPVAEILSFRGDICRRSGKPVPARQWYERALAADPGSPEALIGKGRIIIEGGGNPEEATALFTRARTRAPGLWEPAYWLGRAALARGDISGARSHLTDADRLAGEKSPGLLCAMGLTMLRAGSREGGGKLLLASLAKDPIRLEALRGLEKAMKDLGDSERAAEVENRRKKVEELQARLSEVRAAPKRFEEKGQAFLELGMLHQNSGASREAMKFFQLARDADPGLIAAHRKIASLARAPREIFFRANALARIIRLDPGDTDARRDLALIYAGLGVRAERARQLAEEALKMVDSAQERKILQDLIQKLEESGTKKQKK